MRTFQIFILLTVFISFAFKSTEDEIKFSYPKKKGVGFTMKTSKFKKFKKEWQGHDYYYLCDTEENGIICSVLFYKLSDEEKQKLVEVPKKILKGPSESPIYPYAYFSNYSNLKPYESNQSKWGSETDDFMFSHSDVKEFDGVKINQKHMYGYAMYGEDIFVNIHLSKINCTNTDSTEMRQILSSLSKMK